MKALIIYATVEGQTRKIAETSARYLEENGWSVSLMNVSQQFEFALERPDAVLLMAPVHANDYTSDFIEFVRRESSWLNSVPSAFVSVSLSIHSQFEDERTAVVELPETLSIYTGWRPSMVHHAAGALRFGEYDFFKRLMVRYMATREVKTADKSQNHEFTDWDALKAFVQDFANSVSGKSVAAG
ncbi:flavodoxin domain-containing protein [Rhizobium sp. L1K21]|uniref:flavodoxin domain-containing protein n=1 Tax=Rhizobium sp. L1K21 TaxID=2954933 RepID=UPI002093B776|nr:flavodoxin domain-containing protein [Rhizobium sp. L1K21]MCO6186360.1 protoporphyrinogen oxidase [Rhizobium sp. L1K21]